jgi:Piwi domain
LGSQLSTPTSGLIAQGADTNSVDLNGFELALSSSTFKVRQSSYPDNSGLKELRKEHADWILSWRDGTVFAIPRVNAPRTSIGTEAVLAVVDHLSLIARLIEELLPEKFPQYDAFWRRPFVFIGKKEELVFASLKHLKVRNDLVGRFTIRPTYTLEAKIIEPHADEVSIGLFLTTNTKWEINAELELLQKAGVDLSGLYVIRQSSKLDERRLVGQIRSINGGVVYLSSSYDESTTVATDSVVLEGSKTSFSRCLKVLLGPDYEKFETARRQNESTLLNGPAIDTLLTRFHSFFSKSPTFRLTSDLDVTVGKRLVIGEKNSYQPIHRADPVQYYFNAARTKSNLYPWLGLTKFGPFSRDTFAKRTPSILVVFPEAAQGAVETFLKSFKDGVPSQRQYEGGFGKLFGLVNPTLPLCKVRFAKTIDVATAYREAIEEYIASSSASPDAAIVVLYDEHADFPDETSPYLRAKASLLMLGVPTQEIRVSKLTRPAYELQYILQNFSIALYAKMNGTPWTVNQDTTISDELIIGLGTSEISSSRFDRRTRYVGVTTVFRGDGNYLLGHISKECSYEEYPEMLRDTTERVLSEIRLRNGWAPGDNVRMIFHTYKPLKNVEVAEIAKRAALVVGHEQTIEFAFLTVTVDHPFLVLDRNQKGIPAKTSVKGVFVPDRGTIVQIGKYTRLLCTNGAQLMKHEDAPLPAPLLVHIHKGSTFHDLTYLSEQILKFTGLSWRSTLPAKKPVSIYYSELIAHLLGRLRSVRDWSPAILNVKLRASRWFL